MKEALSIAMNGHVKIIDENTGEVLLDKDNAIHGQNMARILSRGLANEANSVIKRMAFGNGGTFIDATNNVIFKTPNDGNNGDGWESRLYSETYSEIVDESDPNHKTDPGSAGPDNVRIGGGASPSDDPDGGGVTSQEVGTKSNVTVTVFLNENEPMGQLPDANPGPVLESDEVCFLFDEIGLYSPGKPASSTAGYSNVDVGDKTSEDDSTLVPNSVLTLNLTADGVSYSAIITVPAGGTGTAGAITFGDIAEGINNGSWITGGDNVNDFVFVFITDRSGGTYPTITGQQSFGFLTFQSKTNGSTSSVNLTCTDTDPNDFFNVLTGGICANCNVLLAAGEDAGVINDPVDPANERERLLTLIIFSPILKGGTRVISITYTLTVSVSSTSDSTTNIVLP